MPPPVNAGGAAAKSDGGADAASIVYAVLSAPNLQPYLHFELPGRLPLQLLTSNLVTPGLELPEFAHPIRIIEPNRLTPGQTYLVSSRRAATPTHLTIAVEYPIEGLSGEVELERRGGAWHLVGSSLREH